MDGVGAGEPILRISDPASLFLVGESATKGGDSPTTLVDQSASSAGLPERWPGKCRADTDEAPQHAGCEGYSRQRVEGRVGIVVQVERLGDSFFFDSLGRLWSSLILSVCICSCIDFHERFLKSKTTDADY